MLKSKFKAKLKRHKAEVCDSPFNNGRLRPSLYLFPFTFCLIFAVGCRMDMQDQPRYEVYEPSTFFKDGLSSRPLIEGTVARGYLRADTELYSGKIDRSGAGQGGTMNANQNAGGRASGDDAAQQTGQTDVPQATQDNQSSANTATTPGNTSQSNAGQQRTGGAANQAGGATTNAQGDANDVENFPFPITAEVVNRGQDRYQIFCAMCHGNTGYGDGMIVRRGFRKPPSYHTDALRNARVGHLFDVITNGWGSMPSYNTQVPVRDRWAIIAYIRALQLSQQAVSATDATTTTAPGGGAQLPNTGGPK